MKASHLNMFIAVTAAMLFTGIPARAADTVQADVRQISGEITWVDVKQGLLQLEGDTVLNAEDITEYRINKDETRVTDPSDKKFLSVDDLQPGQHVLVDVIKGKEDKIIEKITVNPRTSSFQESYGQIEVIDTSAGTLTLVDRPSTEGESNRSYFVFDLKDIVVMQAPSRLPVQLAIKPGDVVKVEFVVKDGKRWVHSITLYSPRVTSTTTTTTTVVTQ